MIYRRFGYLQSRILLQKQDEMRELEDQLDTMDKEDMENDFDKLYSRKSQGAARLDLLTTIENTFCQYCERCLPL